MSLPRWLAKLFPHDSNNRFVQPEAFYTWIQGEFNKNTPWDKFATTVVTASGTVSDAQSPGHQLDAVVGLEQAPQRALAGRDHAARR